MIKIKFNMDFRGEYIRNLEDLRNNFSVEDILEAYDNGLLVRWLDARGGYTDQLRRVREIEAKNARGVLEELIRIFCPETEQEEIDENLALYDYLEGLRKFRDYITTNGLYELGTIRQERDKLTQELANVKTERDALKQEISGLREEIQSIQKQTTTTEQGMKKIEFRTNVLAFSPGGNTLVPAGKHFLIRDMGNIRIEKEGKELYVKSDYGYVTIKKHLSSSFH